MQIDHFASAILVRRPICSWRVASYRLDDALVSPRKGYLIFRSLTKAIFQSSDCCGKGTAADGLLIFQLLRTCLGSIERSILVLLQKQAPGGPISSRPIKAAP
jgi:hypothetical protein